MTDRLIVGCTGHRPGRLLAVWQPIMWRPALEVVIDDIMDQFAGRSVTFRHGAGIGFDLIFAGAALMAKDRFGEDFAVETIIPYDGFDRKWSHSAKQYLGRVIERSTRVAILPAIADLDMAYRKRNRFVVDGGLDPQGGEDYPAVDVMTTCWDQKKGGGTAWTATYAEQTRHVACRNLFVPILAALKEDAAKRQVAR